MGFIVELLGSSFIFGFMVVFRIVVVVRFVVIFCFWVLLQLNLLFFRDVGLVMKDFLIQVCVVNINFDVVICILVYL